MRDSFLKLCLLVLLSLNASNAFAKDKIGSHVIYFEDRHSNEVEVTYNGSYQYHYTKNKWLPVAGSYNFIAYCSSSRDCKSELISNQIAEDFVSAIDAHAFYTWVSDQEVGSCKPEENCQRSNKGKGYKKPAQNETAVSKSSLTWSQALKNSGDIFKQLSSNDSIDKGHFLIYKRNGLIHDLCVPKGTECQSVLDIKRNDDETIEASITFIRSNPAGKSLSNFLDEILQSGKVFSSCQIKTNCSTLSDEATRCTSSFSCFY